jgi:hypothetical protein
MLQMAVASNPVVATLATITGQPVRLVRVRKSWPLLNWIPPELVTKETGTPTAPLALPAIPAVPANVLDPPILHGSPGRDQPKMKLF